MTLSRKKIKSVDYTKDLYRFIAAAESVGEISRLNILQKLKDSNILAAKAYTLNNLLAEYERCITFSTSIQLNNLDVEKIKNELDSLNEEVKNNDSFTSVKENYLNALVDFKDQLQVIQREYKNIKTGLRGEQDVEIAIGGIKEDFLHFKNIRFNETGQSNEHDFIVINRKGIFTIEVKTLSQNVTLSKQGVLDMEHPQYIVKQLKRHVDGIKDVLERHGTNLSINNIPIYPIILLANNECNIIDELKNIPICYLDTLEFHIFNNKYKNNLNTQEIKDIYDILKSRELKENKFPPKIDVERFYENIGNLMYGAEYFGKLFEYEPLVNKKELFINTIIVFSLLLEECILKL